MFADHAPDADMINAVLLTAAPTATRAKPTTVNIERFSMEGWVQQSISVITNDGRQFVVRGVQTAASLGRRVRVAFSHPFDRACCAAATRKPI